MFKKMGHLEKRRAGASQNAAGTPPPQLVVRTPLELVTLPDHRTLYIKNETCQGSGAFKLRGSCMALSRRKIPARAVTTASTGNHAIGLSTAAKAFGYAAEIFVPETCPPAKLDSIRRAGGRVTLVQGGYEDAVGTSKAYANQTGASYIPSYDDHDVIDGNCGIFSEVIDDLGAPPQQVLVPVGGGGLLAAALQSFDPAVTEVIGVEYAPFKRVDAFRSSGQAGTIPTPQDPVPASVEGISVRTIGDIPFQAVRRAENLRIVQITEAQLRRAVRFLWQTAGIRAELGAGAGVAACLSNPDLASTGVSVSVVTGGNIDEHVFRGIVDGTAR